MSTIKNPLKLFGLYILLGCLAVINAYPQGKHPYASIKPIPEPVAFEIPGADNPWHFAFTPDGKTIYFIVESNGMEAVSNSKFENGKWSKAQLTPFSGKYRIESPSISPDGSKFFFALVKQIDSLDHAQLYVMDKTGNGWSEPRKMETETIETEFHNCARVVNNGNLYFSSDKDGQFHIYKSKFENGKYSAAEKLGSEINRYQIFDFCIAPDESFIIFERYLNLYISFNNNGIWTKAKSLGHGINTKDIENRPCISPDGNYLFFKRGNLSDWRGPQYMVDLKPIVESARKELLVSKTNNKRINIASGKKALSSSIEGQLYLPENAVDGSPDTRWSSGFSDPQWFMIDLGRTETIDSAAVFWEAFARKYKIEVSSDLSSWKEVYTAGNSFGELEGFRFEPVNARFVKLTGLERGTPYGYSIIDFEVFTPKPVWEKCTPLPEKNAPKTGVINGKIYAVAPAGINYKDAGCVYAYDPARNTWSKKADMPVIKRDFQTFVFDNKLYTLGGLTDTAQTRSATLEEYDPVTNRWEQKASMKTAREGIGIIVYKDKIYAMGGFKARNDVQTDAVEVYDPKANRWESRAAMPTGRAWFSTCILNDKIYTIGGYGDGNFQKTVEEYDPKNNTWVKKNAPAHSEPVVFAKTVNGAIYAVSSMRNNTYLNRYEPKTDTWTDLAAPQETGMFDFAGLVKGTDIYIISGFRGNAGNAITTVQKYDVSKSKWTLLPDLAYGRVNMGAEIAGDAIYVIGGQFGWYRNPIPYTESVEKLDLSR